MDPARFPRCVRTLAQRMDLVRGEGKSVNKGDRYV